MADVIIIGAGLNGLVAANYLAKAGKRVLVLERRAIVGGQAATESFGTNFTADALHAGGQLRPDIVSELDLTRQVITTEAVDDDAIWQLHVTMHFSVTSESDQLGSGNRWCHDPSELEELRSFVDGADATKYARSHKPDRVDMAFEQAG